MAVLQNKPESHTPENDIPMAGNQEDSKSLTECLGFLEGVHTAQERQQILNTVFTEERRENLVATAPEDSLRRKVRYYRFMPWDKFCTMLEEGESKPEHFFEDFDSELAFVELKYFLLWVSLAIGPHLFLILIYYT